MLQYITLPLHPTPPQNPDRYGTPDMCTEAGDVAFATVFRRDWALPLLRACLHELSGVAAGQYIAGRVCNMVLQYLTQALAFSHTWKELKVTLPSLLPRCGMGGRGYQAGGVSGCCSPHCLGYRHAQPSSTMHVRSFHNRSQHSSAHQWIPLHSHCSVIFPMLCFSESDAELWQENPHEYIRKVYSGWQSGGEPDAQSVGSVCLRGNSLP